MLCLCIFALLIHVAFSSTSCNDDLRYVTIETQYAPDLIGNWTYVYHWDSKTKPMREFVHDMSGNSMNCPEIWITAVNPEYVKAKKDTCGDKNVPFKWSDAKLRVDAPLAKIEGGIIFIGEKENWLMSDCGHMVKIVMNKFMDDYMVLTNPDVANSSELIARKTPSVEELECVIRNLDTVKGMSGFVMCV